MPLSIKVERCYPSDTSVKEWRGYRITDEAEFDTFLKGRVKSRVTDEEFEAALTADLQALTTTQMSSDALIAILSANPVPLAWEIGEAIAECLLEDEFDVSWPWNENRDRKTPRASLPGADLVGFCGEENDAVLLLGEVKTSFDKNSPPGVMAGRHGLSHQVDELAKSKEIHGSLIRWLHARCKNTEHWPKFQMALTNYLNSRGKRIALVGVLLRDTVPQEDDLRTRGKALADLALNETEVRLDAWYVPRPINDWVKLTMDGAP